MSRQGKLANDAADRLEERVDAVCDLIDRLRDEKAEMLEVLELVQVKIAAMSPPKLELLESLMPIISAAIQKARGTNV